MLSHPKETIVPFLKWAGGKRWLVEQHPELFDLSFERYIEPFLGSGSVYFSLLPRWSQLSDTNTQLIECYKCIRNDHARVEVQLRLHHERHCKDYYYKIRAAKPEFSFERAAQFIYLNRTCFNGLYRVNLKGQFNVPIGTKTAVVMPSDNFKKVSLALQKTHLTVCDFEVALKDAGSGDLVYLDPPYTVKHNYNGFLKYNEKIFSWEDQVRLKSSAVAAADRGAKVIISNAAHTSLKELYQDAGDQKVLRRSSVLSAKPENRGSVEELVVVI